MGRAFELQKCSLNTLHDLVTRFVHIMLALLDFYCAVLKLKKVEAAVINFLPTLYSTPGQSSRKESILMLPLPQPMINYEYFSILASAFLLPLLTIHGHIPGTQPSCRLYKIRPKPVYTSSSAFLQCRGRSSVPTTSVALPPFCRWPCIILLPASCAPFISSSASQSIA